MDFEYQRNLRGKALAKEALYLNGHQNALRFVAFEPIWLAFMLAGSLSVVIPPVIYALYVGLLGTLLEIVLWCRYFLKTRNAKSYPGLLPWLDIQMRRHVMGSGRMGSRLGLP